MRETRNQRRRRQQRILVACWNTKRCYIGRGAAAVQIRNPLSIGYVELCVISVEFLTQLGNEGQCILDSELLGLSAIVNNSQSPGPLPLD